MRAITQNSYGSSEVLSLAEIDMPVIGDGDLLVRVHCASVHAGDYFTMRGAPYLARFFAGWPRPRNYVPGLDVAGTVEAIGKDVTSFKPNDQVFGECGGGGCAEYVSARADRFALKPAGLTFEQAAAVPVSALAALQGLRDAGKLQAGHKVLINGASGGVGTYAVQIAKVLGANVTGVCSTVNLELVRSIGADHVIDYTNEDFTQGENRYDLILDNVGNHSFADCRRSLTPNGIMLPNTGNAGMSYVLKAFILSVLVRQQGAPFMSAPTPQDMTYLSQLLGSCELTPVIDRVYPLSQTPQALEYVGTGHARGKVVIEILPGESGANASVSDE